MYLVGVNKLFSLQCRLFRCLIYLAFRDKLSLYKSCRNKPYHILPNVILSLPTAASVKLWASYLIIYLVVRPEVAYCLELMVSQTKERVLTINTFSKSKREIIFEVHQETCEATQYSM